MSYEKLSSHSYLRLQEKGELLRIRGVASATGDTRIGSGPRWSTSGSGGGGKEAGLEEMGTTS